MWFEFVEQNWLVFSIILIALLVVVSFLKTIVKWAFIVFIIVTVTVYGGGITRDNVNDAVMDIKDGAVMKLRAQALHVMLSETKQAVFHSNRDGTYTIKSSHLELNGIFGSDKVNVKFNGMPFGEWNVDDNIRQFLKKVKQNK